MNSSYWKIRCKKYNDLAWVKNKNLLDVLIKFSNFKKTDHVLDLGCGTGIVSLAIVNKVNSIFAIDSSKEMLAKFKVHPKITKKLYDIIVNNLDFFPLYYYDKIIGRMVFHHLTNFESVFKKCYHSLNKGGELIIQEGGVYPSHKRAMRQWYSRMMELKEDRYNFSVEELKRFYKLAGFKKIKKLVIIDKDFSINNWLKNSGQSVSIQNYIYDLHYNAPEEIKKDFGMRINGKEILIESSNLMIKGSK
jgi:ubiquinone/menaquinone biosynthesis C-methylase UbiE